MRPQPSEEEIGFILDSIAEYLTVKVCAMPLLFLSIVTPPSSCKGVWSCFSGAFLLFWPVVGESS